MKRALIPIILVTLTIVGLQLAVFSSLRFDGVVVMLVWLWPFAIGLTGVTGLAMWGAMVSGLFFDTHSASPFGLTIVVAVVLAYVASRLGREGVGDLDSAAWWVTPALAGVAGLLAPALYVVLGYGELNFGLWRGSVLASMEVNAVAFFLLARPSLRLARAIARVDGRSRG